MADIPYYKISGREIPSQYTTDWQQAYYTQEGMRNRREAQLKESTRQYEGGLMEYGDYTNAINRVLGKSIGLAERSNIGGYQQAGQEREWGITDAEMASQFAQGKITYDQYNKFLADTLGRYKVGSSQYQEREETIRQIDIDKQFSDIDQMIASFNTGNVDYRTVRDNLKNYLAGFAEDSENYNQILDRMQNVRNAYSSRAYSDLSARYSNGELTYSQYMDELSKLGQLLSEDATAADYGNVVIEGVGTLNEIYQNVEEGYYSTQDSQRASEYEQGLISFTDYANYLKERLTTYQQETEKYTQLSSTWKEAYNIELNRYYAEVEKLMSGGYISQDEWALFQEWFKQQVEAGPKMETSIGQFTYVPSPIAPAPPAPTQPGREGKKKQPGREGVKKPKKKKEEKKGKKGKKNKSIIEQIITR